jgi:hypothetical protein
VHLNGNRCSKFKVGDRVDGASEKFIIFPHRLSGHFGLDKRIIAW